MKQRFAPFLVLLEARYAPLLFAVAPQAYAVYLWLFPQPYDAWGETFAVMGAVGYEFVYVGAIAWAEEGRSSVWTWATAVVALLFSVVVAFYVYRAQGAWAWLHAGFPLVAFTYTLNMYSKRSVVVPIASAQTALETLPERSRSPEAVDVGADAADPWAAQDQALLSEWLPPSPEAPSAPLATNGASAYHCPHCQAPLRSKQARGAAVANGYCPACKADRLTAQKN